MSLLFIAATILSTPQRVHFRIPNSEEITLLRALKSGDMAKIRPYISSPVRIQTVQTLSNEKTESAIASRFTKPQAEELLPVLIQTRTLSAQTTATDCREILKYISPSINLDVNKSGDGNRTFYVQQGDREILGRMVDGSIALHFEIKTSKGKHPQLKRIVMNMRFHGWDDEWMNRRH